MVRRVHRRGNTGFSILEALTVVVVMGILSTFVILVYGTHQRGLRTKTSARQIETLFLTARSLAINQNAHFQAVLDLNTQGLWIDRIDTAGLVVVPKVMTPDQWSQFVRIVDGSINGQPIVNGLARIRFHPNGTSDSARLLLLSEGGEGRPADYYTVKLYSPTARSRIFAEARL
jgi:Tfp pilus assembly protein FimT